MNHTIMAGLLIALAVLADGWFDRRHDVERFDLMVQTCMDLRGFQATDEDRLAMCRLYIATSKPGGH